MNGISAGGVAAFEAWGDVVREESNVSQGGLKSCHKVNYNVRGDAITNAVVVDGQVEAKVG